MDVLAAYIPELVITLGIALLAIEVVVLGFATFILFFLGLSLVVTGVFLWIGVLPSTWTAILLSNAILTAGLALFLWRPLLKMQNQTEPKAVKSDFDGVRFWIDAPVDKLGHTSHLYSGINWSLKSDEPIPAGSEVEVVRAEVGIFWVRKTD